MNTKASKNRATSQLFRTVVDIPSPFRIIQPGDRNVFLGSCFAEHMDKQFQDSGLQTICNPTGPIYSPLAMTHLLTADESHAGAVQNPSGQWHTWLTDTTFCRPTAQEAQQDAALAVQQLREAVANCDNLFLTFGTDHTYYLQESGTPVVNCHKHPQQEFEEVVCDQDMVTEALKQLLTNLLNRNPHMQVVLTVSPYRYAKYGFHESQLSKARLLLMVDALCKSHERINYFPAYEIVLDELRDYRFYADDMLHPATAAADYIWQRLQDEWLSDDCCNYISQAAPLLRTLRHKPSDPTSPEWLALREATEQKLKTLNSEL